MTLCSASHHLGYQLSRQAARLTALGAPAVAQALSGFVGDLPPLSPTGAGSTLTQSQIEAFAALYYYAELEELSLIALAELLTEERYSLEITDRALFQALEELAQQINHGWYDPARRQTIFQSMLGFGTAQDIRQELRLLTEALTRFDAAHNSGPRPYAQTAPVELAFDALLRRLAGRGALGLARAAQVLNGQLHGALAVLGNQALHRMFNAYDIWGLVRALVVAPDGQSPDTAQIVDRAQSGAAILGWTASKLTQISARDGSLNALLTQDASLLRHAQRWLTAAQRLPLTQPPPSGPAWDSPSSGQNGLIGLPGSHSGGGWA